MPKIEAIDVRPMAQLHKALSDPTRLSIFALLSHGELCVCHIQTALSLPQSNISRQLAILRAAGIVGDRRDGTWVHYRLLSQTDPGRDRYVRHLADDFKGMKSLARVVADLRRCSGPQACC